MKTRSGRDLSLANKVHLGGRRVQGHTFKSNPWANLPTDNVEEILAKLPFSSLIRFCSVCKGWKELILSSKLFPRCSSARGRLCYFLDGSLHIFNSNEGTWKIISLKFLPSLGDKYLNMSTGGLLCFSSFTSAEFIVCNPVTQYYKKLQMPWRGASTTSTQACMPAPDQDISDLLGFHLLTGMVPSCDTGHFKLIVGGFFEGSQGTTLVYDSRVDSWKKAADTPDYVFGIGQLDRAFWHDNVFERPQPTTCGGDLYFFFKDACPYRRAWYRAQMLKYDVENELWSWIGTSGLFGRPLNFIEHRGKPMLVTMGMGLNNMQHFKAYELQDGGSNCWVHTNHLNISRLNGVYPSFTRVEDCLGQGDVVFLINKNYISAQHSFREWLCNSDIASNWKDYLTHYNETCVAPSKVFVPSTILLK